MLRWLAHKAAVARVKWHYQCCRWRVAGYQFLGLDIGERSSLGRVRLYWPGMVKIGSNTTVENGVSFQIFHPFREHRAIVIGDHVYIGTGCQFMVNSQITIGSNSMVATGTILVDNGHEFARGELIRSQPLTTSKIVIGEDVWIGAGCVVLLGVEIGNGAIVGAGSVVNKSIPADQVWAGVPARFIRER